MPFIKGRAKTGGRVKGTRNLPKGDRRLHHDVSRCAKNGLLPDPAGYTPNALSEITATVRDCIEVAFHKAGGAEYLSKIAKTDPRTFLSLLGRIVPTEVAGKLNLNVTSHEAALIAVANIVSLADEHRINGEDTGKDIKLIEAECLEHTE